MAFDEDRYIENLCGAPYNLDDEGNCVCPSCRSRQRRIDREERDLDDYDYKYPSRGRSIDAF